MRYKFFNLLVKIKDHLATIVDLSGIIFSSDKSKMVVYTTSIVVNRNYLTNIFNNANDQSFNMKKVFSPAEKVMIISVVSNRFKEMERFKMTSVSHFYYIMQYKYFF